MSPVTPPLVLKFSHNVVEHLGLKLYQNKPTRVIAELVSNSWDADASKVDVNLHMEGEARWVAVHDNGHGMTREEIAEAYLIVGRPRRKQADDKSRTGRSLMGRKGIGKLAPFGIANTVDVVTRSSRSGGTVVWLRFHLDQLLGRGDGLVEYTPEIVADSQSLVSLPVDRDPSGQVAVWVESQKGANAGTLILMTSMSLQRAIPADTLTGSLGERFTVTIGRDFNVSVNGVLATQSNALPAFEFRIPESGHLSDSVDGRPVRCWVGFVKSASWPQDAAGVGVYSHGKIAQDRPFTFGVKGKEIFARYMFGVIEADWLDEMGEDLISTDRTSINWDSQHVRALHSWGQDKVRAWTAEFEKWRRQQEEDSNRELVGRAVETGGAPRVTKAEEDEIVRMVSAITPNFGKDEAAKEKLVTAISDAWVQKPMRRLVKDLWNSVGASGELPPEHFTSLVERLSSHSVPESLNLAVVFAQRAFALSRLYDYVHNGIETDLQKLIARFPWIIEPDLAVLTVNEALATALKKAEARGQLPTGNRDTVAGVPDRNKPDFVFLSSPEERQIVVVELKGPQDQLTIENRQQLSDYMVWFEKHYPNADIKGFLIGSRPDGLKFPDRRMLGVEWTEILKRSRARNLELLAAMILATGGASAGDARLADALQLGGPEAKAMLDRLAAEHVELRELMAEFAEVPEKREKRKPAS